MQMRSKVLRDCVTLIYRFHPNQKYKKNRAVAKANADKQAARHMAQAILDQPQDPMPIAKILVGHFREVIDPEGVQARRLAGSSSSISSFGRRLCRRPFL